ncbi:MAG: hypothetical protein IPM91_09310 [Bacteroidetes bacterium]|nr:hypothetical protein [Bacteroidota bacterium]
MKCFQYFDVDSGKNIIITPEFYHASIPVLTCDAGNYFSILIWKTLMLEQLMVVSSF